LTSAGFQRSALCLHGALSITDVFSAWKFRHLAFVAIALFLPAIARSQAVTLDVSFRLTDLDYKPLRGVPVRLVFGSDPDWQGANSGHRFVTDASGWTMPELSPLVLTHAGYEPWDYLLDADPGDPTGRRWTLRIAFKQWPPPVRR
jgi:hypothetical protein